MPNLIVKEQLSAELATLEQMLAAFPGGDLLGRIGLESRRKRVLEELGRLQDQPETAASIALYFAGAPVVGSQGIEADFATKTVATFQDLITNLWATNDSSQVGERGPVSEAQKSHLHITALLHGSVGFVLEEIGNDYLFPSTLKQAAGNAAELIAAFGAEDDRVFDSALQAADQRVLSSVREFFRQMQKSKATARIVEGTTDLTLSPDAIGRAFVRAESATIEEAEIYENGQLIGVMPIARKFEFRADDQRIITGSVAPTFSESYLKQLEVEKDDKTIGRRWRAHFRKKVVTRFAKRTETVMLLNLEELRES